MKRRGWRASMRRYGAPVAWTRRMSGLTLVVYLAPDTLAAWACSVNGVKSAICWDRPSEAAAQAEDTARKLLAKSLRMLLGRGAVSAKARGRIAESLQRLLADERRELLRQLLREVEKGGGA